MRFLLLAACVFLAACGQDSRAKLPDVRLQTLSSSTGPSLAACPASRCLTVYLAPWCGYCRQATPAIIALSDWLKSRKVETRVIVGMDAPPAIKEYAQVFGPQTLIDPQGSFRVNGVPHFYVTNEQGGILKEVSGFPMGVESVEQLAAYFGLP